MQVDELVRARGLDLTETEYAALLFGCARGDQAWADVETVLLRMGQELTVLAQPTLAVAEALFR